HRRFRRVDIFRKQRAERDHWEFRRSLTASPRKLFAGILSRCWNLGSMRTRTDTDPADRQSTPSGRHDSAAGAPTGSLISTSKGSSTVSIMSFCSRRSANTRTAVGVLLYVERWLKAPIQVEDGRTEPRMTGTPQGGVVSPLLANLFLHYVFDRWMAKTHPHISFERYADDIICHCRTESEAAALLVQLKERFLACRLRLHPQKTKIVYCKDTHRTGAYPVVT